MWELPAYWVLLSFRPKPLGGFKSRTQFWTLILLQGYRTLSCIYVFGFTRDLSFADWLEVCEACWQTSPKALRSLADASACQASRCLVSLIWSRIDSYAVPSPYRGSAQHPRPR